MFLIKFLCKLMRQGQGLHYQWRTDLGGPHNTVEVPAHISWAAKTQNQGSAESLFQSTRITTELPPSAEPILPSQTEVIYIGCGMSQLVEPPKLPFLGLLVLQWWPLHLGLFSPCVFLQRWHSDFEDPSHFPDCPASPSLPREYSDIFPQWSESSEEMPIFWR